MDEFQGNNCSSPGFMDEYHNFVKVKLVGVVPNYKKSSRFSKCKLFGNLVFNICYLLITGFILITGYLIEDYLYYFLAFFRFYYIFYDLVYRACRF